MLQETATGSVGCDGCWASRRRSTPDTEDATKAPRQVTGLTRAMPKQPVQPGPSSAASTVLADSLRSYATAGTGGIARRWLG